MMISIYMLALAAQPQPVSPLVAMPPVPTAESYLRMTPQQRYDLRISIRSKPLPLRRAWLSAFKESAITPQPDDVYLRLHEEREQMDRRHNTSEPPL